MTRAAGLLALLTAAAAVLRFATLDLQSFWYDEAVTVGLVGLDLTGLLERIPDSESTPPLYYLAAWAWTGVFGDGEVGIRSLSALIGTLTVPAFYVAARELTESKRAALVVAALAAFNPLLVWYSQEARAYALAVLLCGLSLACFGHLVRTRDGDGRWLAGWALTSALALATHYFAVFLVLPCAALLLWHADRRGRAGAAVAVVVLAGAALVPLAAHQASLELTSFIGTDSVLRRVAQIPKQLALGFNAPLETLTAAVAIVVLAAGALVALARRPPLGVRAAALVGGVTVAIPIALALVDVDYLLTRNVLVAWLPARGGCRRRAGAVAARPGGRRGRVRAGSRRRRGRRPRAAVAARRLARRRRCPRRPPRRSRHRGHPVGNGDGALPALSRTGPPLPGERSARARDRPGRPRRRRRRAAAEARDHAAAPAFPGCAAGSPTATR